MAAEEARRDVLVDVICENLRHVLRGGIRPAKLLGCRELLELRAVKDRTTGQDPYARAIALEAVLTAAIRSLGTGPQGLAAQLLFGVDPDSRGRALKDRRRLAAQQFDVLPSTFRRNYEDDLLRDVAVEVWRAEHKR